MRTAHPTLFHHFAFIISLVFYSEIRKLAGRRQGLVVLAVNVVGHFPGHRRDESIDFGPSALGPDQHSAVGQILHVTRYPKTAGDVPGRVAKPDPLHAPVKQDLAPKVFAGVAQRADPDRRETALGVQRLEYKGGQGSLPAVTLVRRD